MRGFLEPGPGGRGPALLGTVLLLLAACAPTASESPSASVTPTSQASASSEATPTSTPAVPALEIRLTIGRGNPPNLTLEVEILTDGQVVEVYDSVPPWWTTRNLNERGMAQVREAVLDAPLLQTSADYPRQLAVPPEEAPIGISGTWIFTIGEGAEAVTVTSDAWLQEAEALYYVPSPEREELDRLAGLLMTLHDWVADDGWATPSWDAYQAESYLLWVTVWPPPAAEGIPSAVGVDWPFDGPIEAFGDEVAPAGGTEAGARCGYIDAVAAEAMVTVLAGIGIETQAGDVIGQDNSVNVVTDNGWVGIYLSPRTPTGFPTCADEVPYHPPYGS